MYLADIWPSDQEVQELLKRSIDSQMFRNSYGKVFQGDDNWASIQVPAGNLYRWDEKSTYVKNPPYFEGMTMTPAPLTDITGARVLALLGDSVTTDHISPAGNISEPSPAARYLIRQGVEPRDFNSYGARREPRSRSRHVCQHPPAKPAGPGVEGGVSVHLPDGEQGSIYDVAMRYRKSTRRSSCSRATGVRHRLLARLGGQGHVAARGQGGHRRGFERIHRSNLIGMGVAPLRFRAVETATSLRVLPAASWHSIGA